MTWSIAVLVLLDKGGYFQTNLRERMLFGWEVQNLAELS